MLVLGIDPGTINLGYALVSHKSLKLTLLEAGVIKFKNKELKDKILDLASFLVDICSKYEIDEIAIESLFFGHNPKGVLKLAEFRGAILLKVLELKGDYFEYTPLQIKSSTTGNGKATKEQVSFMVRKMLGIQKEIKPLDITDAIAVAITHIQRR